MSSFVVPALVGATAGTMLAGAGGGGPSAVPAVSPTATPIVSEDVLKPDDKKKRKRLTSALFRGELETQQGALLGY